ncbi:MAG: hypothetical protein C5B59_01915 [Bacteroidetes bacterium]|nr:MAG: hypothetical protein C5B59_01915 [Bacteroidota bacterium]
MKSLFTCILLLCFSAITANAQQQVAQVHVSKKQIKGMTERYEELQKEIKTIEDQRAQLQKALKDYDSKIKAFTEGLEKVEQQYDEALPQSEAQQLLAATKQMDATRQAYNIQYFQLENHLQNETSQFAIVSEVLNTKLETIKKTVKKLK